jgi:hypothetical protein
MPESHSQRELHSLKGLTQTYSKAGNGASQNLSLSHWCASFYLMWRQEDRLCYKLWTGYKDIWLLFAWVSSSPQQVWHWAVGQSFVLVPQKIKSYCPLCCLKLREGMVEAVSSLPQAGGIFPYCLELGRDDTLDSFKASFLLVLEWCTMVFHLDSLALVNVLGCMNSCSHSCVCGIWCQRDFFQLPS